MDLTCLRSLQKPQGGLRLVTDFSHLSKFVERPVHPFNCTQDVLRGIPASAKIFAKLDAKSGYHQIPLDEHSSAHHIHPPIRSLPLPSLSNEDSTHHLIDWNLRSDEGECQQGPKPQQGLQPTHIQRVESQNHTKRSLSRLLGQARPQEMPTPRCRVQTLRQKGSHLTCLLCHP